MSNSPVVRISKGRFPPERYEEVLRLAEASAVPLIPALEQLRGLLYYFAGVDPATNTFVNVSIWRDLTAAKQMATLGPTLPHPPTMDKPKLQFDKTPNSQP